MSNSGVITTMEHKTSIYLHWNGGRDSVDRFLEYCAGSGIPSPEKDSAGWAQLCSTAANYFGADGLHIGLIPKAYDPWDNGIYVIEDWKIVAREGRNSHREQAIGKTTPTMEGLRWDNQTHPKETSGSEIVYVTSPYPLAGEKICIGLASDEPLLDLAGACAYCKELGFRDPHGDNEYGYARLVQVLSNYLGPSHLRIGNFSDFEDILIQLEPEQLLSVGAKERWGITDCTGSAYVHGEGYFAFSIDEDGRLTDKLCEIASAMPDCMRIPEAYFRAEKVLSSNLELGDVVMLVPDLPSSSSCPAEEHVVLGFGADRVCNGGHVKDLPLIDAFEYSPYRGEGDLPSPDNPNNYLTDKVYRVVGRKPDDPRIPAMAAAIEADYRTYANSFSKLRL